MVWFKYNYKNWMHSFEVSLGYESIDRTTFSTWSAIENVLRSTLSYPNETSKECIQFLNDVRIVKIVFCHDRLHFVLWSSGVWKEWYMLLLLLGMSPVTFFKFSMTHFLTWPNQIKLFFNAIPVKVLYFVNDHKNLKSSGWQKKPKAWNK